jgi:hypothetical protein
MASMTVPAVTVELLEEEFSGTGTDDLVDLSRLHPTHKNLATLALVVAYVLRGHSRQPKVLPATS